MGSILVNFYLRKYDKPKELRKDKEWWKNDPRQKEIRDSFKSFLQPRYKVNIKMAVFGIRNLVNKATNPQVIIRLTSDEKRQKQFELNVHENQNQLIEDTRNPNFGDIIEFPGVVLPKELLCWPYIEIKVKDNGQNKFLGIKFSGCEECFTTISLIDFAHKLIDLDQDIIYAQAQLQRN